MADRKQPTGQLPEDSTAEPARERAAQPTQGRRGADRRAASERRRSARGLFELRARREDADTDRRRGDRRDGGEDDRANLRTWWGFWRRNLR
jgi:hypothetical protein